MDTLSPSDQFWRGNTTDRLDFVARRPPKFFKKRIEKLQM